MGAPGPVLRHAQRRAAARCHRCHRLRRALHARAPVARAASRYAAGRQPVSSLVLRKPDDWHLHVRDGAALAAVLPHTAARFVRAIIMPNLKPPITTTAQAIDYRRR